MKSNFNVNEALDHHLRNGSSSKGEWVPVPHVHAQVMIKLSKFR